MVSDPRVASALTALAGPIGAFRSAIAAALGRADTMLVADTANRAVVELGDFAHGRVNPDAFAALVARSALDAGARTRVARAAAVLRALESAGDDIFVVEVPRAGDLRREVAVALARLGCVFGASRSLDTARGASLDPEPPDKLLDLWPFEYWTKTERLLAPPLVVVVGGADLHAASLSEFMDGTVRIVLIVNGSCAPAPLARLVSPGVLVTQCEATELGLVAKSSGPAIAAVLDGNAARFVHDPRAGRASWQRITISQRPASDPRASVGRWSAWQQRDELLHLYSLAQAPSFPDMTVSAAVGIDENDAAGRLASWLLEQAQLDAVPRG
ncbi:MAG TPA: hypothetical protein VFT29_08925 [Gemmatimonadaceae bacterium]|nr:hypothetical protein [Gemmatimonadaceae bacterium]